jgi:hypothetical protein
MRQVYVRTDIRGKNVWKNFGKTLRKNVMRQVYVRTDIRGKNVWKNFGKTQEERYATILRTYRHTWEKLC